MNGLGAFFGEDEFEGCTTASSGVYSTGEESFTEYFTPSEAPSDESVASEDIGKCLVVGYS